jgi:hypothetical protein
MTTTQRMTHSLGDSAHSYSGIRTLHILGVKTHHCGGIIKRSPGDWTWVWIGNGERRSSDAVINVGCDPAGNVDRRLPIS